MKIKATAVGLATFTLKREGEFIVKTAGDNHCGATDGNLKIYYTLEVRCTADSLDDRGFLFNQMSVKEWFTKQKFTSLSCEAYTVFCGRELYKLIRRENPKCHIARFTLTLSPAPHEASLTFCYGPTAQFLGDSVYTLDENLLEANMRIPLAVMLAIEKRWPNEALEILQSLQYDSLNGCYYFIRWGMYVGVETDGYIHT